MIWLFLNIIRVMGAETIGIARNGNCNFNAKEERVSCNNLSKLT